MWKEQIKTWMKTFAYRGKRLFSSNVWVNLHEQLDLPVTQVTLEDGLEVSIALSDAVWLDQMVEMEKVCYPKAVLWDLSDFYVDLVYHPSTFYLQVFLEDELLAFMGCRKDRRAVHISNIMVLPSYQRRGIGRMLMQLLKTLLPSLDRERIDLEVRVSNQSAQRFYEKEGFKNVTCQKNYYLDNQEDAFIFAWERAKSSQAAQPVIDFQTYHLCEDNEKTAQQLSAFFEKSLQGTPKLPISSLERQLSNPYFYFFVLKDEEENWLGAASFQKIDQEGELFYIAIHPETRNQGLGRRLLQEALQTLQSEGMKTCYLEVRASNVPAQKLYENFHFVKVDCRKNYYQNNQEDAKIYKWEKDTD